MAAAAGERRAASAWRPAEPLARLATALGLVVLLGAIALASTLGPEITERRAAEGLVRVAAVVALFVFVGNSGVISFGHVGFMAIGAYASGLLTLPAQMKGILLPDLPAWLAALTLDPFSAALAGSALAALFALIVGAPLMRLSGIQASIATFALLSIVYTVIANWTAVTGGSNSMVGLPVTTTLPTAFAGAAASVLAAWAYGETRSALLLRASREDLVAARSIGIRIERRRLEALVLSAFLAGFAGTLYGHFLGVLRPDMFHLDLTFLTVAMLVIGGMRSLTGAVIGAVLIGLLSELFRLSEVGVALAGGRLAAPPGLGDAALALIMLLVVLFRPRGLVGDTTWLSRRPQGTIARTPASGDAGRGGRR